MKLVITDIGLSSVYSAKRVDGMWTVQAKVNGELLSNESRDLAMAIETLSDIINQIQENESAKLAMASGDYGRSYESV